MIEGLDGAIATVATGIGITVTAVVVVIPSLDAVIVAVPGATPLTSVLAPDAAERLATAPLLVDQVITRPASTLPAASRVVAVSVAVCPWITDGLDGAIDTVATGIGVTVTIVVVVLPSLVAVIVAVPAATPVTAVLAPAAGETLATALLLDDQVIARPVSTPPPASVVVAVSVTLWRSFTEGFVGAIATAATGTWMTVTTVVAVRPSLVAVIVDVPGVRAVMTVLAAVAGDSVATALLLDVHVMTRPVSTLPAASLAVADSVTV